MKFWEEQMGSAAPNRPQPQVRDNTQSQLPCIGASENPTQNPSPDALCAMREQELRAQLIRERGLRAQLIREREQQDFDDAIKHNLRPW